MSLGSPRRTMRFPQITVERIEAAILSANARRADVPYDWTGWVMQAVKEKLRSLERARASTARRRARSAAAHQTTTGASAEAPVVGDMLPAVPVTPPESTPCSQ